MPAKPSGRSATTSNHEMFGLSLSGWLRSGRGQGKAKAPRSTGRALFIGQGQPLDTALAASDIELPKWVIDRATKKCGELVVTATADGPLWLLAAAPKASATAHAGLFQLSPYAVARDLAAQLVPSLLDHSLDELTWLFYEASPEEQLGALVGLELGGYRYKQVRQPQPALALPRLQLPGCDPAIIDEASRLSGGINLARHLVNLPAADLNPTTYSDAVSGLFAQFPSISIDVWRGKKLQQEGLGLLAAVGQAASEGPALVHLAYRPAAKKVKKGDKKTVLAGPVAFVGKGITFDSGGLDIKPAAGMRLMKKDMGGSASLVGLAYYVAASELPVACDFYLALAENAVSHNAFHPGDILKSRAGLTVEIDNTDAEGRLVLADALDVAVKAADKPSAVINLATLTGAMRVALGLRIAGMFANDDALADALLASSQRSGDPTWRMPLYGDYFAGLKSNAADFANAGGGGYAGAVTAALFLQRFVGQVPWAHADLHAWTEGNTGGCLEPGGNGQWVQLLVDFLKQRAAI